jgi:hypothetical protein
MTVKKFGLVVWDTWDGDDEESEMVYMTRLVPLGEMARDGLKHTVLTLLDEALNEGGLDDNEG